MDYKVYRVMRKFLNLNTHRLTYGFETTGPKKTNGIHPQQAAGN